MAQVSLNCKFQRLLLLIGSLVLFCLPLRSFASAEFTDFRSAVCGVSSSIQPKTKPEEVKIICKLNQNCQNTFDVAFDASKELQNKSKTICERAKTVNTEELKLNGFGNQQDLLANSLNDLQDLENLSNEFKKKMEDKLGAVDKSLNEKTKTDYMQTNKDLIVQVEKDVKVLRSGNTSPQKAEKLVDTRVATLKKTSTLSTSEAYPELIANLRGSQFINNLSFEMRKQAGAKAKLANLKSQIDKNAGQLGNVDNNGNGDPNTPGASVTSGDGLAGLMPMVGAAAPLAAALMQKKSDSGSDLSGYGQQQAANQADAAAGASLGQSSSSRDGGTDTNKVGFHVDPGNKPKATGENPEHPYSFGSNVSDSHYSPYDSNEKSSGRGLAATTGASASPGAPGALSMAGDKHETGANPTLESLIPKSITDESLGAFNAGGSGGGPSSPFSAFDTNSNTTTNSAGGMDDLFKGMENAVPGDSPLEDAFGSFDGNGSANQSSGGEIGAADGENLFTRIRLCYQRSIKKGAVLGTVPEKVF